MSDFQLKVLTWNIDGLDEREIEVRMISICDIINLNLPDVVMLQEVVSQTLNILKCLCTNYRFVYHKETSYFNILMFKKNEDLTLTSSLAVLEFDNSDMERNLLEQEIIFHKQPVVILTSHLESLKDYSKQRQLQLQKCFSSMVSKSKQHIVIFGGDLNLREPELKAIGGLPNDIKDSWIENGMKANFKFTWNLKINDNKSFGAIKPTARYDRLYFKPSNKTEMVCKDFSFVGMEKIGACNLFPSDHFGILSTFNFTFR